MYVLFIMLVYEDIMKTYFQGPNHRPLSDNPGCAHGPEDRYHDFLLPIHPFVHIKWHVNV